MEQRTSSPHIITLYGMTAGSQLLELAPGGELTPERVRNLSPQKKLEYAINISQAVADLHGPDNTLVHSDIWGSQIGSQLLFMADGTFKLSDFNQGFFQRWNKVRNLPCPMQGKRTNIMKKPYEEIANMPKSEKIDIYGIGVMLYFLLSTCRPYQCEPIPVNIIELKRDGIPPTLPIEITNSTIPEITSMRRVMNLALQGDPEKRPSAQSIVNLLKGT
jgi:serine/threonine protein kinase